MNKWLATAVDIGSRLRQDSHRKNEDMSDTDLKQIWLSFAHDAAARYTPPDDVEGGTEALVDDMSSVAVDYADAMLDAFEERLRDGEFDGAGRESRRSSKGRSRRRRGGDEPGDD